MMSCSFSICFLKEEDSSDNVDSNSGDDPPQKPLWQFGKRLGSGAYGTIYEAYSS